MDAVRRPDRILNDLECGDTSAAFQKEDAGLCRETSAESIRHASLSSHASSPATADSGIVFSRASSSLTADRRPVLNRGRKLLNKSVSSLIGERPRRTVLTGNSTPLQVLLGGILVHPGMELLGGLVIAINFIIIILEVDSQAADTETHMWLHVGNSVCLAFYVLEFALRIAVERWNVLNNAWNQFDLFIITVGILSEFVESYASSLSILRIARCFRVLRMMRVFYVLTALQELRKLMQSFLGCLRTLLWSFILLAMIMTMWSTIAVTMLHGYMDEIATTGVWDDCERCHRAFSSVFNANLTFFTTVIAGDSWGKLALPVIEAHPWSAVIFVGVQFVLVFGVLNLIIAVLVDSAAEARDNDTMSKSFERDRNEIKEKNQLGKIFEALDLDNSGAVSLEELKHGAESIPELHHRLRAMDINSNDLDKLFTMLDEDGSGDIDPREFSEILYRVKCGEQTTATALTKEYVAKMQKDLESLSARVSTPSATNIVEPTRTLTAFADMRDEILRELRSGGESLDNSRADALAKHEPEYNVRTMNTRLARKARLAGRTLNLLSSPTAVLHKALSPRSICSEVSTEQLSAVAEQGGDAHASRPSSEEASSVNDEEVSY